MQHKTYYNNYNNMYLLFYNYILLMICIYTVYLKSFITLFNIVKFRLDYQIGVQFCKSNQTLNIGSAQNLI